MTLTAPPTKFARLAAALAGFAVAAPAIAHDFWIQPSSYHPAAGERVDLVLRVGDEFKGEAVPRRAGLVKSFVQRVPGAKNSEVKDVLGIEGRSPAGFLRPTEPGLHVIAFRSTRSFVMLEPDKFSKYLREEGLECIGRERVKRGESKRPGREHFARNAKTLLRVGDGPSGGWDAVLGLELEIVPEVDPFALRPEDELVVRLLYQGKPIEGVLVNAQRRDRAEDPLGARTDAQGRVRFEIDEPGDWIVSGVHMVRAADGGDADWDSEWASLTFDVRPVER